MAIISECSSSKSIKQVVPMRLFELLKEKQDPFVLEIYLLERGCKTRNLELNQQSNNSSVKNLKKPTRNQAEKSSSNNSAQFSSIARSLYKKIVLINGVLRPKNDPNRKRKRKDHKEAAGSGGRCSTASCSTVSNAWSETDTDGETSMSSYANNAILHETVADRVHTRWRFVEENKQCSPDSVLDEIDLLQSIPVYNVRSDQEIPTTSSIRFQKKVSDDSILSASLWEMLVLSRKEKPNKQGSKPFPQYMNSKRALQQTRQLLFDCVRDAVENQNVAKQHRIRTGKGLMGPEEMGKFLCNNLKAWGKLSSGKASVKKLLATELSGSGNRWGDYEAWKREIVNEIGNSIFEDITDDLVQEMLCQN